MKTARNTLPTLAVFALPTVLLAPRAHAADPTVHLSLYGNVDYSVEKEGSAPTTNSFSVPNFDLFMSAEMDRLTFNAEVLFDFDGDTNNITVDVDRIQLSYLFRSWLRITAGRLHTSIGYYNTAYPHGGAFYELAVDRPALVDSHEADALVPTEGTGLRLDGRVPLGAFGFGSYDVEVFNGRGYGPDELTTNIDHDNAKAFNVRLRLEPAFLDGLVIGGNAYFDTIPVDPAGMGVPTRLKEQIFGAHIAYVEGNYHLILEGVMVRHLADDGTHYQTLAALAELGYSFGNVTPYLRLEQARFPSGLGDPFYALGAQMVRGNYVAVSGGLKWMATTALALKLELEDNHATADDIRSVTTQVAFAF